MNINATLIGQMIAFAGFVWFCMKFVWPPLIKALEDRQNKIASGLDAAEKGQHDLELAKNKASEILKDAKAQAAVIVDKAHKRATEMVEEAKTDARVEAEKIVTGAKAEVEREANRIREELREHVSAVAIQGAEKILERDIKAEDHKHVLDKLIAEL